jgi:formate dehydrogenase subunit delta
MGTASCSMPPPMSPEKLVYMANQIGRFFANQPPAQAIANTADHLQKFWDPRMRRAILAHLEAGGGGLETVALQAVQLLKTQAERAAAAPSAKN